MKGKTRRKRKQFWKPIVIGFTVMYLATMGSVTWLVKGWYVQEYLKNCENLVSSLLDSAYSMAEDEQLGGADGDNSKNYLNLANQYVLIQDEEAYLQFSAAFYDTEKNLLAKSSDSINGGVVNSSSDVLSTPYVMDDYLSYTEKEELAAFYWDSFQESEDSDYRIPEKYRFYLQTSPDRQELAAIYVQQITWEEGLGEPPFYVNPLDETVHSVTMAPPIDYVTGKETGEEISFHETDSKIVWQWTNPDISDAQRKKGLLQITPLNFPYLKNSYERWRQWSRSEYLQGFPKEGSFDWESGLEYPIFQTESDSFYYRGKFPVKVGFTDNPSVYLEVRMEAQPWLAAMNYMKYVYLAGFVLTLTCMAAIIYVLNKTYDRQALLEETRRDFTNAIAHELKTPLGIIRNFAENLFEHNMEEKRDYYISQIIGQTEELDHLVAEMIEVSKLESEEMALKKETVSFSKLIHQQADRFEPMIREKNILIRYEEKADFQIEGDSEYLARAIWNLLSNAVDYNMPDGNIFIKIDSNVCTIENSGFPMDEEQLAHAFDLFYTSSKSRGKKEKHMGMGLFLAKKILELHGLSVALEDTGIGVRAVIRRTGASGKEKPRMSIKHKKIMMIPCIALLLVFSVRKLTSGPVPENVPESIPEYEVAATPQTEPDQKKEYQKEELEKRLEETIRLMAEELGEDVAPSVSIQNLDAEDTAETTASVTLYTKQSPEISEELQRSVERLITGSIDKIPQDHISIAIKKSKE